MEKSTAESHVRRHIEEWKQKLIDLTRRNRLLYFKQTKGSTLIIAQPDAKTVLERLIMEAAWEFWFPPKEEKEAGGDFIPDTSIASDQAQESKLKLIFQEQQTTVTETIDEVNDHVVEKQSTKSRPPKSSELVIEDLDRDELEKIIKNLYRRSSSDYEERGVRILHLALGMLEWRESNQSEIIRSPLILVPVELGRESARDPFRLLPVGEDIVLNPALQVKLRKDFNIELPPLPDDWEEVSLYDYFNNVVDAGGKLNWSVKPLALIGLFSFHKIVMHQDLEANEPVISKHLLISALSGETPEQGIIIGTPIDEKELDSIREPDRMFHILDADSSQQVCIELARQGQSFVLHGPPGTGKSQTISNIIAEFIEGGKTVLFVSEKMAALEVVYKRLREAGLGDFCLELHSHKTNKREVIKELNRSLEERIVPKKSISEIEFQRLLQLRDKLNNYVTALHRIREPLGESVFNVFNKIVSPKSVKYVPVNIPNIDGLTPGKIVEFEELILQMKNVWRVAEEGKNFPWYGYRESRITLEIQSELTSLLDQLMSSVQFLKPTSTQYASSIGLDIVLSLSDVEWLVKIGNLLSQSPGTSPNWLIGEELDNLIREATHYQELFNSYRTSLNSLQKKYGSRFFELPVDFTSSIEEARSQTFKLLTTFDFSGAELLTHHAIILEFVKNTKIYIKQWLNDVRNLARHLGLEIDNLSLERIKQIGQLSLLCFSHSRPEANWLDSIFLQNVKNILPKTRESYTEYKHKKQSIMEQYYETIFELDLDRLAQCYSGNYRTLFDLLIPAFFHPSKQDAKTITTYHKTEQNYTAAMFSAPQSYKEDIYGKGIEFLQVFERFQQLSRDLLVSAYELLQILGVQVDHTSLENIRDLARLVIQTGEISCEAEWLDPVRLKQVGAVLPTIKNDYLDFKKSKEKLMENYDESFLEMDLDTLIEKYNSAYKRLFRLLKPSYYKDQKAIARTTRSGNIPTSLKKDLLAARELKRHAIRLEKERGQTAQMLGRLFQGHITNFELIELGYNLASEGVKITGFPVPHELIKLLSFDTQSNHEIINLGHKLIRLFQDWSQSVQNFTYLSSYEQTTITESSILQSSLPIFEQWLFSLELPLSDLKAIAKTNHGQSIPSTVREDLLRAYEVKQVQVQLKNESENLNLLLGQHFKGEDTDFDLIEEALNIAIEALLLIRQPNIPKELLNTISLGTTPSLELQTAGSRILNSLEVWEKSAHDLSHLIPVDRLPGSETSMWLSPIQNLEQWVDDIETPLSNLSSQIINVLKTCSEFIPSDLATLVRDLQALDNLRDVESAITRESERLQLLYGSWFLGVNTKWSEIVSALNWTREIRFLFGNRSMPALFVDLASQGAKSAPDSQELTKIYQITIELFQSLQSRFDLQERDYNGIPLRELELDQLLQRLIQLRTRIDELQDWIAFKVLEKRFVEVALFSFLQQLTGNPPPAHQLLDIFRRGIYQAWVDRFHMLDQNLGDFRGQNHEQTVAEFRELDQKLNRLSAYLVIEKANLRKPRDLFIQARDTEVAVLKQEGAKRRRHLPIRRLFERIPNLLTRLKPCLFMSPLSVSQFLPSTLLKFDLVVFDEASQICTEDAVGSIYRGHQLVVAGDNKQLPPTAFFQQGIAEEYDWDDIDDEEFAIFESILDQCKSIGLPEKMLKWHYRSKHESLIAFSNKRFYLDRLITFPSCRLKHETLGIKFYYVHDGVYDRGGKRNNPREAQVVADLAFDHLRHYPTKTLGVVAFNLQQMTTIEDEIELRRRAQPEFEQFFKEDRLEGFFVKNLENVQGDERDVIIFSIGYGFDQHKRITMNFGPLNKPGGERRLNVAVTRAREKVILVSSIRATDIDLNATQAAGVLNLYHYLDYAERGSSALELSHPTGSGEYESPLEEDIASEIKQLGYQVIPQVGCSGYRIDLGVVDPNEPGRFILAVECDGATYHSAYTARDRDRLRQQVLEAVGWRIHRIWSPDWIAKRDTEIKKLKQAIEGVRQQNLRNFESKELNLEYNPTETSNFEIETQIVKLQSDEKSGLLADTIPYKVCKLQASSIIGTEFHLSQHRREQSRLIAKLVDEEGPVHILYVARRLISAYGLGRMGHRVVKAIKEAVKFCQKEGTLRREGKFLWPPQVTKVSVRVPVDGVTESFRPIEHIPPEEVKGAMLIIIRHSFSIGVESLLIETARIFGFNRTGDNIRKELLKKLKELQEEGIIVQNGNLLMLRTDRT